MKEGKVGKDNREKCLISINSKKLFPKGCAGSSG